MATNNDLLAIVNYIERERGVDREIVLGAIESAVTKAAVRNNPDVTRDLRVAIDRKTLMLHVYDTKVVTDEDLGPGYISVARARRIKPDAAEGETLEIEIPAAKLGRIVAAATRQGITDAIHNAERDNTFVEYKNRVGAVVGSGIDLQHIHAGAGIDGLAAFAAVAGIAVFRFQTVDRLSQNFGAGGLTGAPGAGEQIGMAHPSGGDLRLQGLGHRHLPRNIIKGLRTVFPI